MFEVLRRAPFLLLLACTISHARSTEIGVRGSSISAHDRTSSTTALTGPSSDVRPPAPSNATCMSRTINYITHTLPKQCLRTDRVATHTTQNATTGKTDIPSPGALTSTHEGSKTSSEGTAVSLSNATETASSSTAAPTSSQSTIEPRLSISSTASSTSLTGTETAIVVVPEPEPEADSPLDNANFLSFEEWKKQNLAKAGQSPDHVGQARQPAGGERQRPGINNALDTFGEESEIDLDFAGFGSPRATDATTGQPVPAASPDSTADSQASQASNTLRSKDAGKTCKERTNYASFDCAATILKSNSECKSASSVLVESKDSYMLNTCSASNKFFIVELCNDILIDTMVLANYEFFSSNFRHFRISVSDRYPVKIEKWRDLGTFEARNTREVQAFLVENPLIWARYLRIEFLTHYGNEYYCPLSLLRVHGTTMMEEFRHQEELARGETGDDEPALEPEATANPSDEQEPVPSTELAEKSTVQAISSADEVTVSSPSVDAGTANATSRTSEAATYNRTESSPTSTAAGNTTMSSELEMPALSEMTCAPTATTEGAAIVANASSPTPPLSEYSDQKQDRPPSISAPPVNGTQLSTTGTIPFQSNNTNTYSTVPALTDTPLQAHNQTQSTMEPPSANTTSAASQLSSPKSSHSTNSTTVSPVNSTRGTATPSTASHHPQPSTQESFYKSIHKRLQQLESNSTLSLQYIEEQSRILRDAFSKVEKRQITATTTFLSHLNETVMAELHDFRQAYDQLWQSTVIELEGQREQYQREMLALSTRLTLVADELVWQKRMGIVQSTLLLLCLGLVLFARQGNGSLEMPFAQQLMTKSQAALRAGWESEPNSPSPASRSPVAVFRRRLWRSSTEPGGNGNVTDATESRPDTRDGAPEVLLEPPTPSTNSAQSEAEDTDGDEFEDGLTTQSGPATPNGTAAGLKRPPEWPDGMRPGSPFTME